MEKITMFGKLTINGQFSIAMSVYQRVCLVAFQPPQQLKFLSASTFPRKITKKKKPPSQTQFLGPSNIPMLFVVHIRTLW